MKRLLIALCLAGSVHADITLPAIFSDHAVLLRANRTPIWGKATPGEVVSITLGTAQASATTGPDGRWRADLDLSSAPTDPLELVVRGSNQIVAKDVLVGEVWFCSGQSNMAFPLSAFPAAKEETPKSANPKLRQFLVAFKTSPVPLDDVQGKWTVAGPDTIGYFSAVAYFFGKKLQAELGGAVGLINDSVGGTVIEAWMSREALDADPALKTGREKAQNDRAAFDAYGESYREWQKKFGREDQPTAKLEEWTAADVDTTDWKPITLPGLFSAAGLPDAGAVWIRRKITAPSEPDIRPNKGIDMYLGDIRDSNRVYWNGRKIGDSDLLAVLRRYGVRFNLVNEGENVLAVRIFNPAGDAGILPGKARFQANHLMLQGEWLAKAEFELPPLDEAARAALPQRPPLPIDPQNVASYLFNGMVHPIIPYGIRGIIWYQGEGNWQRGFQYRTAFPLLIQDWRAKWGQDNLPFYFCQIANFQAISPKPQDSPFAEVRDAQSQALVLPNTGQAVLIDVGEEGDIHPADKESVGDRLVRIALAKTYDKERAYSGPVFQSQSIDGNRIRLTFQHTDGGLVAKPLPAEYRPISKETRTVPLPRNRPDSQLEGFAICGQDRKWTWADAKIEGDTVVVWSDTVPQPIAVRYAWGQNPVCNLSNAAGLPAGPFRTDDFPPTSEKARY